MGINLTLGMLINIKRRLEKNTFSNKIDCFSINTSDLQLVDCLLTEQCIKLLPFLDNSTEPTYDSPLDLTLALLLFMRVQQLKPLLHFIAKNRLNISWEPSEVLNIEQVNQNRRSFRGDSFIYCQGKWVDYYDSCIDQFRKLPEPKPINEGILLLNLNYLVTFTEDLIKTYIFYELPQEINIKILSMSGYFTFKINSNGSTQFNIFSFFHLYIFENKLLKYTQIPHPPIVNTPRYVSKLRLDCEIHN